jgi:3'(2'), 5'-bisphosphate nucleotidase
MNLYELCELCKKVSVKAGLAIMGIYKNDFEIELKADNSPLTIADKLSDQIIRDALLGTNIPIISEESKLLGFNQRKEWKSFWLVDPLDGTKEFISRNGEFTVNIALIDNGVPVLGVVYAPMLNQLYFGISDLGAFKVQTSTNNEGQVVFENAVPLPETISVKPLTIVASRSHMNRDTEDYVEKLKLSNSPVCLVSKGSSLKLCLIAEGSADLYPRFGPTMEWDIAAGHAVVLAAGGKMYKAYDKSDLEYNKTDLLNPYFIAERPGLTIKF